MTAKELLFVSAGSNCGSWRHAFRTFRFGGSIRYRELWSVEESFWIVKRNFKVQQSKPERASTEQPSSNFPTASTKPNGKDSSPKKIQYFTEHLMDHRRRSSVEPEFQGTRQPLRRAAARSATGQGKGCSPFRIRR